MNKVIEELKDLFERNGVSVFGIAASNTLESEPEGHRPSDMISSASSILSFGIPIPKGMLQDQKRLAKNYWRMASLYYQKLDNISFQAAVIIEGYNETASPVLS